MDVNNQASEMSVESMQDCLSDTDVRPLTSCRPLVPSSCCPPSLTSKPSTAADTQLVEDESDASLLSCNSTETLKQWTIRYPVTARCQSVKRCRAALCGRRRQQRSRDRRRRRGNCDDECESDESSESSDEVDVAAVYTDSNGQLVSCRPQSSPEKPCTTTRKRLSRQNWNASHCLMSDTDSSDDDESHSLHPSDVDVDDNCPAKVEVMSCNSSFSDCSLPCHELLTCTEACDGMPEGQVKVRVRPPEPVQPCVRCGPCGPCVCTPCTDRDRYDIKFVSHFVSRKECAVIREVPPIPSLVPSPIPSPIPSLLPSPSPSSPSPVPSPFPSPSPVPSPILSPIPPVEPKLPSLSEETISSPTIITEPSPVIEIIPPPPPPPPPPVVSAPTIVQPGLLGVSGTQVVSRCRKHYGDLCKLIRCAKPRKPCCCSACNLSQSNACCPAPTCSLPCESCCPSSTCVDNYPCSTCRCQPCCCDPCRPPCEPCPPPCTPCYKPCCKVIWVRSITTKEVQFIQPLIMEEINEAKTAEAEAYATATRAASPCLCDPSPKRPCAAASTSTDTGTGRSSVVAQSMSQELSQLSQLPSQEPDTDDQPEEAFVGENTEATNSVAQWPSRDTVRQTWQSSQSRGTATHESQESQSLATAAQTSRMTQPRATTSQARQSTQSRTNDNINALSTFSGQPSRSQVTEEESGSPAVTTRDGSTSSQLLGTVTQEGTRTSGLSESTRSKSRSGSSSSPVTGSQRSGWSTVSNSRCKDPWQAPPGMDQQTFERYAAEIVRTLEPVIPPNPFAVPRATCIPNPDCVSIECELERLLAAIGNDCSDNECSC